MAEEPLPRILTIGHSNRAAAELLSLLRAQAADEVVDIRSVPRSRRNPQFNREELSRTLQGAGLAYRHLGALGGLRRPRPDSPNTGWQNPSLRGFADHMLTEEFERELLDLVRRAAERRMVLLCAEALPWRCHRSLIADALVRHGLGIGHILGSGRLYPHRITSWARMEEGHLIYPAT